MSTHKALTCRRELRLCSVSIPKLQSSCICTAEGQKTSRQAYNGFNLVVGDLATGEVAYVSNRGGQAPTLLQPGVHGISNGQLHSKWPKVRCGRTRVCASHFYLSDRSVCGNTSWPQGQALMVHPQCR